MKIVVYFIGICTHVDLELPRPADSSQPVEEPVGSVVRVVLVNASLGLRVVESPISPHIASLYVPYEFIDRSPPVIDGLTPYGSAPDAWRMEGVQLELANVAEHSITLEPGYASLPRLSQLVAGQLLTLNHRVVNAGGAAGVFRVSAGWLDAFQWDEPKHGRPVIGKLTVTTLGAPQLIVTRVWDQQVSAITLMRAETDPVIYVSNVGRETDALTDFLLHFGVTTWTPDHLVVPLEPGKLRQATPNEVDALKRFEVGGGGMTIGCSNSGYP